MANLRDRVRSVLEPRPTPSSNSRTTNPQAPRGARLTSDQRLHQWFRIVYKLFLTVRHWVQGTRLKVMIGEPCFLRVFGTLQKQKERFKEQNQYFRVQDGELLGKVLTIASKTKKNKDRKCEPAMCTHPPQDLRKAGNKDAKWWTCTLCDMRWERLPIPTQDHPATMEDLMLFGPHAEKTYGQVKDQFPGYVEYLIEDSHRVDQIPSREHSRFAQWIISEREVKDMEEENLDETGINFLRAFQETMPVELDFGFQQVPSVPSETPSPEHPAVARRGEAKRAGVAIAPNDQQE